LENKIPGRGESVKAGLRIMREIFDFEYWRLLYRLDDEQYRRWLPWGSLALGCVRPYWFSRSNSMMISFSRSSGCSSRPISDATAGWTDFVTSGVTFTWWQTIDDYVQMILHTYCSVH